ncbi:MAG: class I SAM-dependent methyltransferase [Pseudomonadales bacterium]|jgi:SAM-dependent methyltransferase|nr:class I SAM-dependent methyltransferase [Pseudomonadales bacterium]MDP7596952.1 class I SAM-dependent methyltransferase [Pseudomonadales bacterium]HJN50868.1 class I SAM-dependent methyltransferase [Pseudomonadales bacterium]|tara:strand:+ start:856 stop:1467 length:612 start_codon:yes stop_codon:yes gene_type:complete
MNRDLWDRRYEQREFVWTADPNQFLVAETKDLSPGRALDLGAGEGRNAVWLAKQGWQVAAIDFSAVGISKGEKLANSEDVAVNWICDDATRYKSAQDRFDLIIMLYFHIPRAQQRTVIHNSLMGLAAGGHFLYVGHDLSNIEKGQGGPQDPDLLCTPSDIERDLMDCEIIRAEVVQRSVSSEPGHGGAPDLIALDTLVHARRS